jgi:hypothetical protein
VAKLLLFIALSTFLISCEQNPDCQTQGSTTVQKAESPSSTTAACPTPTPDPDPTPDPTPDPEPTPDPDVPGEALIFDANIQFHNFDSAQEVKVNKAIEIIKKVVASSEFRNKVLNFTYNGKKQFVDNKGMTNEQIYQALLDGREDLLPEVDHQMDLELELYYSWTSTVGYTTQDVLLIHMNTKFFNPYTPAEVAGNVFHEWTHKLGFDHASSYSVARDSSVPYAIGYLIEELGKKYE